MSETKKDMCIYIYIYIYIYITQTSRNVGRYMSIIATHVQIKVHLG
jgi:hypothetical protein